MILMRFLLLLVCLTYGTAADVAPVQPPYLGVGVEEIAEFDAARGLNVTSIAPGATFDRLGIKEGDRLVSVNGTSITSTDSFRAVAMTLTNGMPMAVVIIRNGANLTVSGTLTATPRPRDLAEESDRLRQEASELHALADQVSTKRSLEEALRLIKQVEEALPKAAEDFKRVYPNGTFRISINIDIRSDQGAKDPEKLTPTPVPAPTVTP